MPAIGSGSFSGRVEVLGSKLYLVVFRSQAYRRDGLSRSYRRRNGARSCRRVWLAAIVFMW